MSTIIPEGEAIRNAVKWISEQRKDHPQKKLMDLVDSAAFRFNLSPKEAESLLRILKDKAEAGMV